MPDLTMTDRTALTLYLANPRGFCAGVVRAIEIVEMAIEKWGPPVYVRHEIVHNRHVVDGLRAKGAVFVEELDECPNDRPVVFSAHGVPKAVPAEAERRNMIYVDATCPLVSKVHVEAERHFRNGRQIVMIGHSGHPETVGTMGQLPAGEVILVETVADVARIAPRDPERLAFITQTTLSVDDTADIVAALMARFPGIIGPHRKDICYATTNRQEAVKAMAPRDRSPAGGRRPQLLELEAAGRGRPHRGLSLRHAGADRCGYRLAGDRGRARGRPDRWRQRAGGAGRPSDRRLPRPLRRDHRAHRHRRGACQLQGAAGAARRRLTGAGAG